MTSREIYKKVAGRYMKRFNIINKNYRNSRARDVSANLLNGVNAYAQFIAKDGVTAYDRSRFLSSLKRIKTYYRLLDKDIDFLIGELKPTGAFPDLFEFATTLEAQEQAKKLEMAGAHSYYVHLCKEKLEGRIK